MGFVLNLSLPQAGCFMTSMLNSPLFAHRSTVSSTVFVLDILAGLSLLWVIGLYLKKRRNRLPLPPGPRRLPFIGNLLDMPRGLEWEVYDKWSKELNTDILYINAVGTHLVILGTYGAAVELLERKSTIYSGRPRLPMVTELMGWDFNFGFMDYGDRWRKHRRLMHHAFHPTAAKKYRPHELKSARTLLRRLLDDPSDIMGDLRLLSGEAILYSTYGLEVSSKMDKYITMAKSGVDPVVPALVPGTFLVDFIPALKYVPSWFPGASFKRKAKEWRRLALEMREVPYENAKQEIERGSSSPSLCSLSFARIDHKLNVTEQEDDIKSVAATLYGAGADSTMAAVASCVLALINHPEILQKAQKQVDEVIKPGHLPDFDDEPALPYITAIVKESMRWRDTTPLGLPHLANADGEYNGYRIPKGSIIIANSWAMLHDETVYPEPFKFEPERFLRKDGRLSNKIRDPGLAIWGFGRRVCPGRYMAGSAIWITVASLIAAFDIRKEDESGGLDHDYGPGVIRIPLPFKCSIKPRSQEVEAFIRSTEREEYQC